MDTSVRWRQTSQRLIARAPFGSEYPAPVRLTKCNCSVPRTSTSDPGPGAAAVHAQNLTQALGAAALL